MASTRQSSSYFYFLRFLGDALSCESSPASKNQGSWWSRAAAIKRPVELPWLRFEVCHVGSFERGSGKQQQQRTSRESCPPMCDARARDEMISSGKGGFFGRLSWLYREPSARTRQTLRASRQTDTPPFFPIIGARPASDALYANAAHSCRHDRIAPLA